MRNIKSFLLYCCCLTCLVWQGCGPDCDADCAEIKTAPQEFLDYWFFPNGSQWVYQLKDSVGIYDTVITDGSETWVHTKNPECNDGFIPCQSNYNYAFTHSNRTFYPSPGTSPPYDAYRCEYNDYDDSWYLFHSTGNNKNHSFSTFVTYPFEEGERYLNDNYLCAVNDTFHWEGKTYPMFASCNPTQEPNGSGLYFQELLFVKNIGLVKIAFNNGEVWELVDYEIAKT